MAITNVVIGSVTGEGTVPFVGTLVLVVASGVAGAVAGAAYHLTERTRARGGWRRTAVNVATLLLFCAVALAFLVLMSRTGVLGE